MKNIHRIAVVAVFSVLSSFVAIKQANAVEILDTVIDDEGNLLIDVADSPQPVVYLRYEARAQAVVTYICVSGSLRPHPDPSLQRTSRKILESRDFLDVSMSGGLRGVLRLSLPSEPLRSFCPSGYRRDIGSVQYQRIEVKSPLGGRALARDVGRVFFAR